MSFVSSASAQGTSTTLTVTAPASIRDGDILVCWAVAWKSGGGQSLTLPTGFTTAVTRTLQTEWTMKIGWKRCASESGNYALTLGASNTGVAAISAYRGRVPTGDPVNIYSDTTYVTSNTTVRAADMTTTAIDDIVWGAYVNPTGTTLTAPGGWNSREGQSIANLGAMNLSDSLDVAAGATGNVQGTAGASTTGKHAMMIALLPAPPITMAVAFDGGGTLAAAATEVPLVPVITAPAAGSSNAAGDVTGTATFTHPASLPFQYEWEVDTDNPPSAGGNYQQLLTGYATTSPRSVVAADLTAGTWYARVRADDGTVTGNWTAVLTLYVFETILLKAGSSVDLDTTAVSNKVFAKVEGTAIVASATNSDAAYPPTYAASPREKLILMKAGDATAAQAVADAGLVVWREPRYAISGLQVRLQDGLKIEVGDRVAVSHALSGVSAWLPVRQVRHAFAADTTTIDAGEVRRVPDDETLLMMVAAKLELLRKDSA